VRRISPATSGVRRSSWRDPPVVTDLDPYIYSGRERPGAEPELNPEGCARELLYQSRAQALRKEFLCKECLCKEFLWESQACGLAPQAIRGELFRSRKPAGLLPRAPRPGPRLRTACVSFLSTARAAEPVGAGPGLRGFAAPRRGKRALRTPRGSERGSRGMRHKRSVRGVQGAEPWGASPQACDSQRNSLQRNSLRSACARDCRRKRRRKRRSLRPTRLEFRRAV
jgi:hypothetical protein